MNSDMEDGISQRRQFDLIDRSFQPLLFKSFQARPVGPQKTARADIAKAAGLEDFVPMYGPLSGNVDVCIRDARQPQTERPFLAGDSAMHPSLLCSSVADNSPIQQRFGLVRISLVTWIGSRS